MTAIIVADQVKFTGVTELSEHHGNLGALEKLELTISSNVLGLVNRALDAVHQVAPGKSFEESPKVTLNLSYRYNSAFRLEIWLESGIRLQPGSIELIAATNGEHNCYALSFTDYTNTCRWQILLQGVD